MSEVKANSSSNNQSTGLIHPVGTTEPRQLSEQKPNITPANNHVGNTLEKPLEVQSQALHPLQSQPPTEGPHQVTPQSTDKKPEIQFNSAIGSKNSQRINPFAEQNAKTEAKKAEKAQNRIKKRKSIKTIGFVLGVIIVVAGIAAGIIIWQQKSHNNQSSEAELLEQAKKQKEELVAENGNYVFGSDAAVETQKEVNDIIASGNNPAEIGALFTDKINSTTNEAEIVNLALLEMESYAQISQFEDVIKASQKISTDAMTPFQLVNYYGLLQSAYYALGDSATAEYYSGLFSSAAEVYQSS